MSLSPSLPVTDPDYHRRNGPSYMLGFLQRNAGWLGYGPLTHVRPGTPIRRWDLWPSEPIRWDAHGGFEEPRRPGPHPNDTGSV